jgi:hypothetical protein
LLLLSQGRNLEDAPFKVNKKMRDFPAPTFTWNRKATGKACAPGFYETGRIKARSAWRMSPVSTTSPAVAYQGLGMFLVSSTRLPSSSARRRNTATIDFALRTPVFFGTGIKKRPHSADKINANLHETDCSDRNGLPLNDFLDIREISYGEFREISDLNPRFRSGSRKVRIVLDVHSPQLEPDGVDLSGVFGRLRHLLPSLEKHQCGERLFSDLKSGRKAPPGQPLDQLTDIAHIMEHVVIDLQSKITGVSLCSGITCGYKNPENRFDLFVECEDRRVGVFSALFAADLLDRLLSRKNVSKRYYALVDLAGYLYGKSGSGQAVSTEALASRISSEFGWRRSFVLALLGMLGEFGLVDLGDSLAG